MLLGLLTICVKNDALLIPHDEMCNEERDEVLNPMTDMAKAYCTLVMLKY